MIEKVWNPERIEDRLYMKAVQLRRPISCVMELTYRCSFQCRMCYIRMTDAQAAPFGRMRTAEEWLDMAGQLRDAGVLYLTLTGGECTRYPEFERLYEGLSRMGFRVSLMSNAGAYTASVRDVLGRFPPVNAAVTLYGGSSETYEAVTGDPKGFENTVENIRFYRSIGVPVSLNFTMIRQNALDYPKVGRLCQKLGLAYTMITDITPHHFKQDYSQALKCRLTPAERACVACHSPEEVALALENAKELEKELAHFRQPAAPAEALPLQPDRCIGSHAGCALYWNGEMGVCLSMRGFHNVKPFETGFEAAWAQLKAEQDKTFCRPASCQACGMSADCPHNCAGRRFEGTGSPWEPDPYICQYAYLLRLYKAKRNGVEQPLPPPCA